MASPGPDKAGPAQLSSTEASSSASQLDIGHVDSGSLTTPLSPPISEQVNYSIERQVNDGTVSALEVDTDVSENYGETDSTYDSSSETQSYTTSLSSSVFNYKYENGRRYHAYRDGEYVMPNDEQEQERLDIVHHIFLMTVGGAIYRSPLVNPQRCLDLGAGTGLWAIEFADQHPSSEVIGIDLSPIQPNWIPPNCKFVVDDIESDWAYDEDEKFDFIHLRTMCGSISNWPRLLEQINKHLKPGGWVELQEYEAWMKSDDDSMEKAKAVNQWQTYIDEASIKFGKRMNVATELSSYLVKSGFINVEDEGYKVPCGPWAKDPKKKQMGVFMLANMLDAVEPVALALFTRVLGHSYEECQALMAQVRAEFRDPKLHLYAFYRYIYGQKPPLPKKTDENDTLA